jgi:cardiolipin synthase A/B
VPNNTVVSAATAVTIEWLPPAFTVAIGIALFVADISIRVLAVVFIPRERKPQTAAAWLLAIFFQPYIGGLLFLVFGNRFLPKKRRRMQAEVSKYISETTEGIESVGHDHAWLDPVVALNRNLGAMPLVGGNQATLHSDYDLTLAEMTKAIATAKKYVHVEFYILTHDPTSAPFFDALEAAVKRGVQVRVMLDHLANWRAPGYLHTIRTLKRIKVKWALMLPVQPFKGHWQRPDLRNHRKILVIDGTVAYTGSQNIIDSSYNQWRYTRRHLRWKDLMVRFEGPIVEGINALFVTDWYTETGELLLRETAVRPTRQRKNVLDAQVVPSGPGFEGENNLKLFNALLYSAQKRIVISSPYFVPDDSMLYAITTAAESGLDVQLFVSAIGDQPVAYHAQRSYYEALLRSGVRIWLYDAPTILHAKHFTIDDTVAVIGSSNMDMRSFSLNLEVSVMIYGRSFVKELQALEADYRASSRELTLEEWLKRPVASRVLDTVARLTAAVQ